MLFAKLVQAAEITAADHVLDVGCTTGYGSAVLAKLAASVVALEEDAGLARTAERTLAEAGAANAAVVTGPLAAGAPDKGPYDVILVEGAIDIAPDTLLGQLKDGGRLIAVCGSRPIGKATLYRFAGGNVTAQPLFDAVAPLLPGFAKPAAFVF
jgi:protein-L-isoaspartate(D-aspartate) O-methyltransferase